MSYNNYLDGDAAYGAVCDFPEASCVIVKHTNPCGAASRQDMREAYRLAVRADPTSAFGGIVAFNRCILPMGVLTCFLSKTYSGSLPCLQNLGGRLYLKWHSARCRLQVATLHYFGGHHAV